MRIILYSSLIILGVSDLATPANAQYYIRKNPPAAATTPAPQAPVTSDDDSAPAPVYVAPNPAPAFKPSAVKPAAPVTPTVQITPCSDKDKQFIVNAQRDMDAFSNEAAKINGANSQVPTQAQTDAMNRMSNLYKSPANAALMMQIYSRCSTYMAQLQASKSK